MDRLYKLDDSGIIKDSDGFVVAWCPLILLEALMTNADGVLVIVSI